MRNEITLTDDQVLDAFEAIGCVADMDWVEFTRDTLADFTAARENYSQRGTLEQKDNALVMKDVQAAKGDRRGDLFVIDFGAARAFVRI